MRIRSSVLGCGLALGCASMALGTGVAAAAPYNCTATITVENDTLFQGDSTNAQMDYCAPSENVSGDLRSVIVHVFDAVTDVNSRATARVTIPDDFPPGRHVLTGTGNKGDTASVAITVLARRGSRDEGDHPDFDSDFDSDSNDLPRTGAEVAGIALTGGALIAAGTALTTRRRRRRY